jgi:hypothetical protein
VVYLLGSIMCLPVLTDGLETMSKQELYAHLRMTGLQNDLMCRVTCIVLLLKESRDSISKKAVWKLFVVV